jgi:hypothetical protein
MRREGKNSRFGNIGGMGNGPSRKTGIASKALKPVARSASLFDPVATFCTLSKYNRESLTSFPRRD